MASFSQPPVFSSLIPTKKTKNLAFSPQSRNFLTFKNSKISSSNTDSSPNSLENPPQSQPQEEDPIKLAFAKAKAHQNSTQSNTPSPKIVQSPLQEPYIEDSGNDDDGTKSDEIEDGNVNKDAPLAVKIALKKANEYKKSKILAENEVSVSKIFQKDSSTESDETGNKNDGFMKADEVKDGGGQKEVPLAVKLAMEKAKEYKKNKDVVGSETLASGLQGGNEKNPGQNQSIKNSDKKDELTVSSIDFMGLGFADKKSGRGLPAGLVPISDPFPEGELPEVEIFVGDTSKFGEPSAQSKQTPVKEDDNADLYKPKVSTWGVFPRPNDISKTYGGGRTLRPGEALETAEERDAKQARTRQLLAAYKTKIGLNIDPKRKFECEKALTDGDSLMDLGKLKEALLFYEKVMDKLAFQSELHGLAALQWSICQDSLSRPNEARTMYEKLQSHPSPQVSKKARQFFFGFEAMEMMKVKSLSRSPQSAGYQNYFEAFVQDKANYSLDEAQVDEGGLNQALPYVIFLVSPIFMVLLIAASRLQ